MVYSKEILVMGDGNKNVFHSWLPENEVKACVVLSHGMTEHAARYASLAEFLTGNGYGFFAEDHRGHGETAELAEKEGTGKMGYLADRDGFYRVVSDIHEEILEVRKRYPGKKVFLLGHSFGSFVSQGVIENYSPDLDGCILCGTAGKRALTVTFARITGALVKLFTGRRHYSPFMSFLAFGSYNRRIKNRRTDVDWLTRDNEVVDRYVKDRWCGFVPTTGFFCDIFYGLSSIHKSASIKKISRDLPVLFIYGKEDPVGSYSKTVVSLFETYRKNGMKNVQLKLYDGARHELFNEINRKDVMNDCLSWLNSLD